MKLVKKKWKTSENKSDKLVNKSFKKLKKCWKKWKKEKRKKEKN